MIIVYIIPIYNEETSTSTVTHLVEHHRNLQLGLLTKSFATEHQLETGHEIFFASSSVMV